MKTFLVSSQCFFFPSWHRYHTQIPTSQVVSSHHLVTSSPIIPDQPQICLDNNCREAHSKDKVQLVLKDPKSLGAPLKASHSRLTLSSCSTEEPLLPRQDDALRSLRVDWQMDDDDDEADEIVVGDSDEEWLQNVPLQRRSHFSTHLNNM